MLLRLYGSNLSIAGPDDTGNFGVHESRVAPLGLGTGDCSPLGVMHHALVLSMVCSTTPLLQPAEVGGAHGHQAIAAL